MFDWTKGQGIRSGKFTAWDHNFEMPDKHLEADKSIADSVAVGTVTHKLKVASNDSLELYETRAATQAGSMASTSPAGNRPTNSSISFTDNRRTVEIRMQEEALSQPAHPG